MSLQTWNLSPHASRLIPQKGKPFGRFGQEEK